MPKIAQTTVQLRSFHMIVKILKILQATGEQDGGGVVGCGVHLSPWIHQEHTFSHRSACRTPAESRQEYLTSRKKYIELHKTQQGKGTRGVKKEC